MSIITEPGVYADISNADYHGPNLTPEVSLSSSSAGLITSRCPAYFYDRSWLNPFKTAPDRKRCFDLGTSAHLMMLEPEKFSAQVAVIDAADWRGKSAKEARDSSYDAGLTPILAHEFEMVQAMRSALFSNPIAAEMLTRGNPMIETTVVARDPKTGRWIRARPDAMATDFSWIVDYKTTVNGHPDEWPRKAIKYGYHRQAAWYIDVVEAATGVMPEKFFFLVQEKEPPYLCTAYQIDSLLIDLGREANRRAIDIFDECLKTGIWPGYVDGIAPFDAPEWMIANALTFGETDEEEK